ncbi:MAG: asparagine synthase (glutamine-hydrolyzing) [Waterburya sp.]
MIFGIYEPHQSPDVLQDIVQSTIADPGVKVWVEDSIALAWVGSGISTLDEPAQPYRSDQTVSVFEGKLYNLNEIQSRLKNDSLLTTDSSGRAIGLLYERFGDDLLEEVNGKFSFAVWDRRSQSLTLGRDRLGIHSLFYSSNGERLLFSSSLKTLLKVPGISKQLNHQAVIDYLLYCYNPSRDTSFFQGIYKLPASHLLKTNGSEVTLRQYWKLSFANVEHKSEAQYGEEIPALIKDAVALRMDTQQSPGVLLSGGIDSSTMVSLASGLSRTPLSTFSFRCQGKSYDESQYARLIANHFGTDHTEVPYESKELTHIDQAIAGMDEPFCDIGIEMATFLLGRAASGKVAYVFSGEGGDELFGGHPVYTADKIAAYVDRVPQFILQPVTQILQTLRDTEQKKNLQVKLKRFAYSIAFPPGLLSHRWRIYYTAAELNTLCTDALLTDSSSGTLFDSMLKQTQQKEPDLLSRSLSSDYWTLVNFYLRRLELLRQFGIENRLPLLDYRLVEYAAKIPSALKLKGFSDTKYIYKQALKGFLPDDILFNRPKLGHSVPMKNWLRQEVDIIDWMTDILSSTSFRQRGFFKPSMIQKLLYEHSNKLHNHSHRLWALLVLELWFREYLDH